MTIRALLTTIIVLLLLIGSVSVAALRSDQATLEAPETARTDTQPSPTATTTPDGLEATPMPTDKPSVQPDISEAPKESVETASILMYHYVRSVDATTDPLGYRLSVTPEDFHAQIQALVDDGYTGVTVADLATDVVQRKAVALSFDDGYEDFYTNAFPVLRQFGWKATVYVVSDWLNKPGYLTEVQIREIIAAGFEIGSHTRSHRELHKLTKEEQRDQLFQSKQTLESVFGISVRTFCYPVGKYNQITLELVPQAGYVAAVTTKPGTRGSTQDMYTLPRIRVTGGMSATTLAALAAD